MIVENLVGLVAKSLLVVDDAGEQRKFRFLKTVREYALERLVEPGDAEEVRGRHAP